MLDNKLINLKEFNNCTSKISKWYNKQSKILSIITNPYNTTLIFINIIKLLLKENKRILYVWNGEDYNREILELLKKDNLSIKYSYIEEKESDENLIFINFKNIKNIRGCYDLCIIDDISKYSIFSKEELREYIEHLYIYSKRIISYSIEKLVNMGMDIEISDLIRKKVFVEPRIITTRVKLDEDMPYTLYDYLMWFKGNNKKVIIYVPSEDKINKVYDYYTNELKIKDIKIIKFFKKYSTKEIEHIYKLKNKSTFIITNNIREYTIDKENVDIVVLFADDNFYNYKKIIYFCADVGKNINNLGEVLLVGKDISIDMDLSKDITRRYNKNIWEKGLLNY
ncbi:hypothetical protein H9660_10765 [Clostridium sp. Sa3CUN1]|uniref:Comf operon protein A, DNA transporter ATPase n=1 Tax=Clostridium gallinarum TaxID=2762246 RepID=A0ABR8Q5F3_9CLOT|nr:hypothetical protein [Clostridium gallinarum]MBD7915625.1 hypothetical protein [Clostridium gallinarum]